MVFKDREILGHFWALDEESVTFTSRTDLERHDETGFDRFIVEWRTDHQSMVQSKTTSCFDDFLLELENHLDIRSKKRVAEIDTFINPEQSSDFSFLKAFERHCGYEREGGAEREWVDHGPDRILHVKTKNLQTPRSNVPFSPF